MVACDGLFKAILRKEHVVSRVETSLREPDDWSMVSDGVGFPVRFDAEEDRLFFPQNYLDQALPAVGPINHARLVALCEKFAGEMIFQATAVSQVAAFLEQSQTVPVLLSAVAAELGYSERGLRRQLDRSGTSYRQLLDKAREQRARDLLAAGRQPIKSIGGMLGFESSSNFARSFKRWTGLTPKAFRERAQSRSPVDHDAG